MARHSLPRFSQLWLHHETLYREIFGEALRRLTLEKALSGDEVLISKRLYSLLVTVCREIARLQNRDIQPPNPESQNWSPEIDATDEPSADKRPDFTCNCIDRHAESNAEYVIPLHVECKRLGEPTSPSWKLNKNYVTHGIARFDLRSHEYGVRAPSAIMIGYVISMTPEAIQAEVNAALGIELPSLPLLNFTFSDVPMQARHAFARNNVLPVEFTLIHLWADIRGNYQQN